LAHRILESTRAADSVTVVLRKLGGIRCTLGITALALLCIFSPVYANETAGDTDAGSQTGVDPADFSRSDLSFSERDNLENQLAAQIVALFKQLDADFPPEVPLPIIEIAGLADPETAYRQTYRFEDALLTRDINALLRMMRLLQIRPQYDRFDNIIRFTSELDTSPSARIRSAIETDDLASLSDILENDQLDLEQYVPGIETYTPLLLAVKQGNVEATRLLLAAGANPDTRDRGQVLSPLFQALIDSNGDIIRLLAEARADLQQIVGGDLRMSPVALSVAQGQLEDTALLLKYGADPDVQDYAGWTALMDAVYQQQYDAIDLLIPVSDPRIESTDDITRRHRSKNLDLQFLPSGNALFLALRMRSAQAPAIADALRDRAATLDPEAGIQQLELSAQHSNSRLNWFAGDKQRAIDAHREALSVVDVSSITELTNGDVITQSMMMLTELHEMLLISGQELTEAEYADVAHITELGGWHKPLHDMLDIMAAGRETYPAKQLSAWQLSYGIPQRTSWNFERLNNWVESIKNEEQRDRLFDVLDFFEMSGWQR